MKNILTIILLITPIMCIATEKISTKDDIYISFSLDSNNIPPAESGLSAKTTLSLKSPSGEDLGTETIDVDEVLLFPIPTTEQDGPGLGNYQLTTSSPSLPHPFSVPLLVAKPGEHFELTSYLSEKEISVITAILRATPPEEIQAFLASQDFYLPAKTP